MSFPHDEDPGLAYKNFVRRRRTREDTIINKAYELYTESQTDVFVLFCHPNDGLYRGFTSQPNRIFPPSADQLAMMYPVPQILDPESVLPLLEQRSRASRARVGGLGNLARGDSHDQYENVGQDIPGDQGPSINQGRPANNLMKSSSRLQHTQHQSQSPMDRADSPESSSTQRKGSPQIDLLQRPGSRDNQLGGPLASHSEGLCPGVPSSTCGGTGTISTASSPAFFPPMLSPNDQRLSIPQANMPSLSGPSVPPPQKTTSALAAHVGGIRRASKRSGRGGRLGRRHRGRIVRE